MALMTPAEVITAAFKRTISANLIKEVDIEIAEFQHIRPTLTENFYDYVVANTGSFSTLITTYLKPCLAHYVKWLNYDEIDTEISDRGVNKMLVDDTQKLNGNERLDIKSGILKKAQILEEKMVDYIKKRVKENDSLFDLYNDYSDVITEDKILGGFLIYGQELNIDNYEDEN